MRSIRFVGGPWHNRVEAVSLSPSLLVGPTVVGVFYDYETYRLCEYRTKGGTGYYQYVHSSLIHGGRVEQWTFRERFPVWRIDVKRLEARLRRAMYGRK